MWLGVRSEVCKKGACIEVCNSPGVCSEAFSMVSVMCYVVMYVVSLVSVVRHVAWCL